MLMIDIGGGNTPRKGYKSVDKVESADFVVNFDGKYFRLPFDDCSVDIVYSSHTLEHIINLVSLMNEIWRVMKWGAEFEIIVPHQECTIAAQDPTHVRFFNAESMKYFAGEYLNKHKLNYGVFCCFEVIDNKTTIVDDRVIGGGTFPYFREQKWVLRKDRDYYGRHKPFYIIDKEKS